MEDGNFESDRLADFGVNVERIVVSRESVDMCLSLGDLLLQYYICFPVGLLWRLYLLQIDWVSWSSKVSLPYNEASIPQSFGYKDEIKYIKYMLF